MPMRTPLVRVVGTARVLNAPAESLDQHFVFLRHPVPVIVAVGAEIGWVNQVKCIADVVTASGARDAWHVVLEIIRLAIAICIGGADDFSKLRVMSSEPFLSEEMYRSPLAAAEIAVGYSPSGGAANSVIVQPSGSAWAKLTVKKAIPAQSATPVVFL